MQNGHVSEKTDAFALGIVIIELLISDCYDRKMSFPLAARGLVNEYGAEDLAEAIKQKQKATETNPSLKPSTWRSSAAAKRAAKALIDVACQCTRPSSKRQVPSQVLPQLQAAGQSGGLAGMWS